MRPTKESRRRELFGELHWLEEKGETFLEHVLDRMSAQSPAHARQVIAFCRYFGLRRYPVSTLRNIGLKLGIATATAAAWKKAMLRRLKHPAWRNEVSWPAIPIPNPMSEERVDDIAVRLAAWRWRQIGTEAYNAELRQAARDLRIDEDEMGRFFTRMGERMLSRKT